MSIRTAFDLAACALRLCVRLRCDRVSRIKAIVQDAEDSSNLKVDLMECSQRHQVFVNPITMCAEAPEILMHQSPYHPNGLPTIGHYNLHHAPSTINVHGRRLYNVLNCPLFWK